MISEELKQQAESGDAASQYMLALRYYKNGEDKDPRQGFLWMKVAAESGYLKAQKALGRLYTSAQHAPVPDENPQEAIRMYRKAAEQDDPEAQYWLGTCYLTGYGTPVSEEEGKRWISAARAKGYEVEGEPEPAPSRQEEETPRREWEFAGKPAKEEKMPEPMPVEYGTLEPETEEKRRSPAISDAEPELTPPRFSLEYVKTAAIYAAVGAVAGLAVGGLLILFWRLFATSEPRTGLFLLIPALIGVAVGYYLGHRSAYLGAGDRIYYHNTVFYSQVQKEYEDLDRSGQNLYEIYARLEKELAPFGYRSPRMPKSPFSHYRGYMIPHMVLPGRQGFSLIDLLLITEKAIYVMKVSGLAGALSGSGEDDEWRVQSVTGRVRFLANPFKENEAGIQSLQDALRALCPGFWLHDIPVYSVVVYGQHTGVSKLTDISREARRYVICGTGERVRSFVETAESRHALRTREMTEVMKAVEHLLKQYPENIKKINAGK